MYRIYHALLEAAVAAIFLIPFFLHRRMRYPEGCTVTILSIPFMLYLSAVYAIAGLPSVIYIRYNPRFNFTPFLYMFSDYTNSLLNVALFIPLGFFLPVLWKKFQKIGWTALYGFLISLVIEFLQIFTYRATDINDLITNTAGTFLGFFLGKLTLKLIPNFPSSENTNSFGNILIAVFVIMFFVQPLVMWVLFHNF